MVLLCHYSQLRSPKKTKYFDGQIADGKKVDCMINFEPKLWHGLHDSCSNSSSVALVNCAIQCSKRSGEYEKVASGRTMC